MNDTCQEYREVEFTPADWLDRAAWWPGLQVYSRPVRIPVDVACPQRRRSDRVYTDVTRVDVIERLLKAAFCEPFESVDLDKLEELIQSVEPEHGNAVAQSVER